MRLQDHLGNTRLMYYENGGSLEVLAEFHYYPHGMKMNGPWASVPTNAISYQYNGIDYVDDFGLNVNMATFRTLDPATGRWWSVDPAAEVQPTMSPYCAMNASPLVYSDPEGDIPPLIFAAAALIGGGMNVFSNWNKIVQNPWSAIGYFGSGAIGGAVSVVNPVLGGSITSGGNIITDVATGNIPELNSFGDIVSYGTGIIVDGFAASGSGKIINLAKSGLKNLGTSAAKEVGEEILEELAFEAVGNLAITGSVPGGFMVGGLEMTVTSAVSKLGSRSTLSFGSSFVKGLFTKKGGRTLYEIGDGVRRSKAAYLNGNKTIKATNYKGDIFEVPIKDLRSPHKDVIDISSPRKKARYLEIAKLTRENKIKNPIYVHEGSRGIPVSKIKFKLK